MKIGTTVIADVFILDLSGNLILGDEVQVGEDPEIVGSIICVQDTLERLVASGQKKIVIDLSGVRKMDSSGLGMLIGFFNRCCHLKPPIKVLFVNPRGTVSRDLVMMHLDEVLPIYSTLDSALAGLNDR